MWHRIARSSQTIKHEIIIYCWLQHIMLCEWMLNAKALSPFVPSASHFDRTFSVTFPFSFDLMLFFHNQTFEISLQFMCCCRRRINLFHQFRHRSTCLVTLVYSLTFQKYILTNVKQFNSTRCFLFTALNKRWENQWKLKQKKTSEVKIENGKTTRMASFVTHAHTRHILSSECWWCHSHTMYSPIPVVALHLHLHAESTFNAASLVANGSGER